MGFENKYPYTDFHELNLDWFLAEFGKLNTKVDDMLSDALQDALEKYFSKIMINAFYDESTETIILSKEIITTSDVHTYIAEDHAVRVG